jgi:UDP-2-acetamido-2-deoxy-ribo-hexuluronate aminotransferase
MNKIQMVDLHGQYLKIKNDVDDAIAGVIEKSAFIKGAEVKLFEENLAQYLNCKHVISCGNGTDALQIALMSLNLSPDDEVITTGFTFIATFEVVALLQIRLKMVDINPQSFTINPDKVESAITPKTKAIVPVHLFGQPADMEKIMHIARKHGLHVIEDVAQAIGSDFTFSDGALQKAGTIGDIGCTSFFPSKNLGCFGDGGALFTNNDDLASKIRSIANHGMSIRYHHDRIGVNSRLDTLQAAILNIKLKKLDEYNNARIQAANQYDACLSPIPGITIPFREPNRKHIFHQYTILLSTQLQRDNLKKYLENAQIPSMVYYPIPGHLQEAFAYLGYKKGDFPVTENTCSRVLSLPMHTELESGQIDYICTNISQFMQQQ